MAILESLPGIEITIQVAGRDAVEYEDSDAAEREPVESTNCPTLTKYIECIDDAEFSFKACVTKDYAWGYRSHMLDVEYLVDGKRAARMAIMETSMVGGRVVASKEGQRVYCSRTGKWFIQKCRFSAISTVDDSRKDRVRNDIEIARNLGLIEVRIRRCIYRGSSAQNGPPIGHSSEIELAEKSLKGRAVSHGASLTLSEPTGPGTYCLINDLHEDGGPIAIFRFHYRSRDALKREMILPRTPSPSAGSNRDVARLSRDELERLAGERLNQLRGGGDVKQERKPALKREIKEVIDLTERPAKLPRRSLFGPAEFIDLTND